MVAVKALCAFTAKHGDLDLRFTPSPSAQEGIAGHALVASRRGEGYQPELSLAGDYKSLRVRGRADGYDPAQNRLEEVKTFRGDLHAMPDNRRQLHWAQLKIYGWLLCREKQLENINLSLVYFDIASLQETPLTESFAAASLKEYFELQCERFLLWAEQEMAHRTARDAALAALGFPHLTFRPGQRELAEAVYRTAQAGKCLMAQATTGIGKTIGTIFPLLKAMPKQRLDKLFFLAAKTPGRRLALDAMALIKGQGPQAAPLRVLELVARDKACEHPDKACHGDSCPLAKGFYDRLPAARSAAVRHAGTAQPLDKEATRQVALAHNVCPYYLSQELAVWSDVVVGDYNYYFDTSAMLYSMTSANQWRVSVLVDEAHNMIKRSRKMYSASLDQAQLQQVHGAAPAAVRAVLARLNRNLGELHQVQLNPYQVYPEIPVSFLKALQQAITTITDFLVANPTRVDASLQGFYFEALHFSRMAESFGAHSLFDITLGDEAHDGGQIAGAAGCAVLNIRNVVPAPFLAPRFVAAHSTSLFSATLSPQEFYRETLGLPSGTAWIDVQSPFTHEQLKVSAVSNISTRFQHRDQSLGRIADLMARQYQKTEGNYLAFLSSYDYLHKLAQLFSMRYPEVPVWQQTRQMDETGREQFLARFTPASKGIGFAVLGGAFAEGIDLPGSRLIGAFVATLGLPQVNPVNEEIRKRMGVYFDKDEAAHDGGGSERGYNYTYLYPGLQKVVQAAGRVIRTQRDTGVIYLIDDRFTRPEVLALLPSWWKVERLFMPVSLPQHRRGPALRPIKIS
jgi:DNA excision repair protein ERCC-2